MKLRKRWVLLSLAAVLLAAGALSFYKYDRLGWRFQLVGLKAGGNLDEITWKELSQIVRPGSRFRLQDLQRSRSPHNAIVNPYTAAADLSEGESLFRKHCVACHGSGGNGTDAGPRLANAQPIRAHSDWAIYRTINLGVQGTSMPAHDLPWRDLWLLSAYVKFVRTAGEGDLPRVSPLPEVSSADLVGAADRPEDWLMFSGNYHSHRFSSLTGINTRNVEKLHVAWIYQFRGNERQHRTLPLVSKGVMYFTDAPATVVAVKASTGQVLWTRTHGTPPDAKPCCGTISRGLAMLGNQLFLGTVDSHLVAIDAGSGKVNWDRTIADYQQDVTITSAPLVVNDLVIVGTSGGDYASRNFIGAFHVSDGSPAWRFETIPPTGAAGHETWEGDSWKQGGAAPWVTGSFDPASNTVYWGVGNPAPVYNGEVRKGDNLYSDSVVALNAATGTLRWHFQFTPHDTHDWDSAQVPVLVPDPMTPGRQRLAWPNRNGFFYSLDAGNGKFLGGQPFVRQNWADGLDANGRPRVISGTDPSAKGTRVWPSDNGASNWWPSSYDRDLKQLYVPVLDSSGIYVRERPLKPQKGTMFGGGFTLTPPGEKEVAYVRAIDPVTGEVHWEHQFPPPDEQTSRVDGVLATSGRLVFCSWRSVLYALDANNGKVLWSFDVGAQITAPPMTYSVDGRQMVAIAAGRMLLVFAVDGVPAG